jgi:hypothetical protein
MTELVIQKHLADYLRLQYKDVLFHSDFGSGTKLTVGQAVRQKQLNGGIRGWPDLFIAEPKISKTADGMPFVWHGLFIELKREGTRIFKKDGALVADEHIREQFDMLHDLRRKGYAAEFACGFDETKKLIDDYMKGRYAHAD